MLKRLLTIPVLLFAALNCAIAESPKEAHSVQVARRFAWIQTQQLSKFSETLNRNPPAAYRTLLQKLQQPGVDPLSLRREFAAAMQRQEGGDPRDDAMRHLVQEAFGAAAVAAQWPSQQLELFIRDILKTLPDDSLYLCSSDAGRFAVQAYCTALGRTNTTIISYSHLSDASYVSYLRWLHGNSLELPDRAAVSRAMRLFLQEANQGTSPLAGTALYREGKLQLRGRGAAAAVNSKLTESFVKQNAKNKPIFLETDQPLPWVYDRTAPDGLLLRVTATNNLLTTLEARRSHLYWQQRITPQLMRLPLKARRMARLRQQQANTIAAAGLPLAAERAMADSLRIFPLTSALEDMIETIYLPQQRYADARGLIADTQKRADGLLAFMPLADKPMAARTKQLLSRVNDAEKREQRIDVLKNAPPSQTNSIELAALLLSSGRKAEADKVADAIPLAELPRELHHLQMLVDVLKSTGRIKTAHSLLSRIVRDIGEENDAEFVLGVTGILQRERLNGPTVILLQRYMNLRPTDWRARLDLATMLSVTVRNTEARKQVLRALKDGGKEAQELVEDNPRLNTLAKAEEDQSE